MSGGATATFVYDGDGRRVKGTVGSLTTLYVSEEYEVAGGVVHKYYTLGGERVAMREGGVLSYLLSDALGSTSLALGATGTPTESLRYEPYEQARTSVGTMPTTYRYTGQRLESVIKLYYYGARWYDASLERFIQPDTVVPEPGNPQSLNRYSYALNNPLRYNDPTGHRVCDDAGNCEPLTTPDPFTNPYGIYFASEGVYWDAHDVAEVLYAAQAIAGALTSALRSANMLAHRMGEAALQRFSPSQVFRETMGTVIFARSLGGCGAGCWAETFAGETSSTIRVYRTGATGYTYQNAAHESGHVFDARAGRAPRDDLAGTTIKYVEKGRFAELGLGYGRVQTGYASQNEANPDWPSTWQGNPEATPGEEFADMFLGWTYNHFTPDAAGAARYHWMSTNMAEWITRARR